MIYLDNAATSFPKPHSVPERIAHILREVGGNPGRGGHRLSIEASRVVFNARETLAALIGAPDSSRVVFTKNATEAINIAIKGLGIKPGGHVITTSFEHNSVVRSLKRLESSGVEVTKVRPDRDGLLNPVDIDGAIKDTTALVCVSHASNVFGAIQPVADIGAVCKNKGVKFMVDSAQTAGALPIDIKAMNIDILAATGHKALFGPQGTGFLYVGAGIELTPLVDGGTGEADTFLDMPERLEAGTMNTPGIGGLLAGVEFVLSTGVAKIREHEVGLIKRLIAGLEDMDGMEITGTHDANKRTSLVAFNIKGLDPVEAGIKLDGDFSIMVRCGTHCAPDAHREAGTHPHGSIRVSPGYFSTPDDIEEFLKAIKTLPKRDR